MPYLRRIVLSSLSRAIQEQRVLTINRLSPRTSPADLKTYFENYGKVYQVYRDIDTFVGEYRGPAFVQFDDKEIRNNVMMQRQHLIDEKEILLHETTNLPLYLRVILDKQRNGGKNKKDNT